MICPICSQPYDNEERIKIVLTGRDDMCYLCYNNTPKVIALDFDATLADYDGWKGSDHKGHLLDGAKEFLEELVDLGFELVIVTARPVGGIQEWLENNKIDHLIKTVSNMKIGAFCYIDDRAITFHNNYKDTLEKIKNFVPWYKTK